MALGGSILTRAAASSIASGRPSTLEQIAATVGAFSAVMVKSGLTAAARWENNATAGLLSRASSECICRESGSGRGSTGNSCSP